MANYTTMDKLYGPLITEKLIDQQLAQNLWDAGFQTTDSLLELPTDVKELRELLQVDCPSLQRIGIAFSLVVAIKKLRIGIKTSSESAANLERLSTKISSIKRSEPSSITSEKDRPTPALKQRNEVPFDNSKLDNQINQDGSVPDIVTKRVKRIESALEETVRGIDVLRERNPILKYPELANELRLDMHSLAISVIQERFKSMLEPVLQQFRSKTVDIEAVNAILDHFEEQLIKEKKLQGTTEFLQEACGFLQELLLDPVEHEGIPIVGKTTATTATIALTLNIGNVQSENFEVIRNFIDSSNPTTILHWPREPTPRKIFSKVIVDFVSLYRMNKTNANVRFVCTLCTNTPSNSSLSDCGMPIFVQLIEPKRRMHLSLPMSVHSDEIIAYEVTPSTVALSWHIESQNDNWVQEGDEWRLQNLIEGYQIFAIREEEMEELVYKTEDCEDTCIVEGLHQDTSYRFSIQTICAYDIKVERSKWSRSFRTRKEERRTLRVKQCAAKVPDRSTANIFHLSRKAIPLSNSGIQKFEIGANSPKEIGKKVLLVVGGTGTGKTTLINSMANYLYEVRPEDPFRFKLISEQDELKECGTHDVTKSQTKLVGAYVLNDTRLNYQLTVIDTPGFGDTEGGTAFDRQTVSYIKTWFSQRGAVGISQIDGICIVVKSTDVAINPHVRHELTSVIELFGEQMKQNVLIMHTFSDNAKPSAIGALERVGIPTDRAFKFNNSAVFEKYVEAGGGASVEEQDNAVMRKVFWEMGMRSFQEFFKQLDNVPTGSLCMPLETLKTREMLEQQTLRLSERIKEELEQAKSVSDTIDLLVKNKSAIDRNRDFIVKLKQYKVVKRPVGDLDSCALTCLKCNFTCRKQCPLAEGLEIQWSVIMRRMIEPTKEQLLAEPAASSVANVPSQEQLRAQTDNATCTVCPAKCHWSAHAKCDYVIEHEEIIVEEKIDEMIKRYKIAIKSSGQSITQSLAEELARDFVGKEQELRKIVAEIRVRLNRLNEIDMTPEQNTTDKNYLDMLIEGEKTDMLPGYQKRIAILERQMPILQLLEAVPAMKQTLPDIDTAALEYLHLEHPQLYEEKEDKDDDDSDSGENSSPLNSQLKFWRVMLLCQ